MNRIEQILFLLDKFCASDEFYHELTMYEGELPRSYLIKQFRNNLNNICHVTPTPGQHEGAQISFESLLVEQIKAMKENSDFNPEKDALKIKISGDGARMTSKSGFVLISCTFLHKKEVMSSRGNHTIAVVNGTEKYETLKASFH